MIRIRYSSANQSQTTMKSNPNLINKLIRSTIVPHFNRPKIDNSDSRFEPNVD